MRYTIYIGSKKYLTHAIRLFWGDHGFVYAPVLRDWQTTRTALGSRRRAKSGSARILRDVCILTLWKLPKDVNLTHI